MAELFALDADGIPVKRGDRVSLRGESGWLVAAVIRMLPPCDNAMRVVVQQAFDGRAFLNITLGSEVRRTDDDRN